MPNLRNQHPSGFGFLWTKTAMHSCSQNQFGIFTFEFVQNVHVRKIHQKSFSNFFKGKIIERGISGVFVARLNIVYRANCRKEIISSNKFAHQVCIRN
jgi:hypothetical protein